MYVTFVHSAVTIVIFFFIYLYFIQQRVEIKIQYTHILKGNNLLY